MAKEVVYSLRGRAGKERYKIVNGKVRRMSEARGEDFHSSYFLAMYHGTQAAHQWPMRPQGIVFDVHTKVIHDDVPTSL